MLTPPYSNQKMLFCYQEILLPQQIDFNEGRRQKGYDIVKKEEKQFHQFNKFQVSEIKFYQNNYMLIKPLSLNDRLNPSSNQDLFYYDPHLKISLHKDKKVVKRHPYSLSFNRRSHPGFERRNLSGQLFYEEQMVCYDQPSKKIDSQIINQGINEEKEVEDFLDEAHRYETLNLKKMKTSFSELLINDDVLNQDSKGQDNTDYILNFMEVENILTGFMDSYLINGTFFTGIMTQVTTPSSSVYLFLDINIPLTHKLLISNFGDKEQVHLSFLNRDSIESESPFIVKMSDIRKAQVFINSSVKGKAYQCLVATYDSTIDVFRDEEIIDNWFHYRSLNSLQQLRIIDDYNVEMIEVQFKDPKIVKEGQYLTCLLSPFRQKRGPFKYTNKIRSVFGLNCIIGSIYTQHGVFTVLVENLKMAKEFKNQCIEKLSVARTLDVELGVCNFGKVLSISGQVILVLPNNIIFKLYKQREGKMGKKEFKKDKYTVSCLTDQKFE